MRLSTIEGRTTPTQAPRRRRPRPRPFNGGYLLSVLCGVLAGVIVLATLQDHKATREVPVAANAVLAGTRFSAADVKTVTMSAADAQALPGLLSPGSVVGRVAAEPIAAGQPLLASEVRAGEAAGAGMGQMSVALPALDADAGNIRAGDHVDVVQAGNGSASYVAQHVLVLSASSGPTSSSPLAVGSTGSSYLVLAVGKQTALRIADALANTGTNDVQVILSNNERPLTNPAPRGASRGRRG